MDGLKLAHLFSPERLLLLLTEILLFNPNEVVLGGTPCTADNGPICLLLFDDLKAIDGWVVGGEC